MRLSLMLAGFLCATATAFVAQAQDKPVLTVLTYDSFVAEWGPGPIIEEVFERDCGCDLRFVGAGDGAALLARLMLEGARTEADVVLGLDTSLTAAAAATGLFAPHGLPPAPDLPLPYDDPLFSPYDWGWFAFVYDTTRLSTPPADFIALGASGVQIVIQDPRSSTPGLGLLLWVKAAYGDRAAEIWAGLADNIVTVTPGWSEAYGMFLAGEADMVLSYTTSPAYHVIAEGDVTKEAAPFSEGHYVQIEVAGRLAASDQPALADRFMAFISSPAFQGTIPETNWMYPATTSPSGLPLAFDWLLWPEKSLLMSAAEAQAARGPALAEWRAALAR
ncbi:thiamine ABC transporter substrate binding subunit [Phaeovulum sp.]|uniref:thiamine ABC transporter substrate binding subunit n=1 Tax=Phaeovulum sp. TaxID=2934796 RepID=UPI002730199B|nr:thiamine ABC transporter substrate binding subunit [Phaeovulum sp.]MDP1669063.1 thiamine ABC transporter substrate binding subunit [Phaeovulum sp.]MDZ4117702.1 thiamine ABC transporter substrate binding subunit [Phaeovulum sp.]